MKCPNCEELLVMTERKGVEIDYCPKCRGVWLDKGELDKIIEKTAEAESSQNIKQTEEKRKKQYDNDDEDDDDEEFFKRKRRNDNTDNPERRKGGFLRNFFDFD
jgi:uncharacterized protein